MPDFFSRRQFGRTSLQVTPLCLGCAELGHMPEVFAYGVPEAQALETMRAFFRSPINCFDTAAIYGYGESERRIGVVLREVGGVPAGYVLMTKADRDPQTNDFSGDQVRRSIEGSLARLGVDHLPVLHLHDPEWASFDDVMKNGGAVDVMRSYKDQGVVGCLGVAGGPVDLMMRYVRTGAFDAVITHNRYTLLNRSADALLSLAHEMGLAVLNAAPYGSGMLAKGPDAYPRYAYQEAPGRLVERVRRLDAACRARGVPLAAAALQFSLRDPRITSTIVGASRPERLTQTLDLARVPIPDEFWSELDAVGYDVDDPEASRWKDNPPPHH